jgi:short-subunit dehydrogenase
MLAHGEPAHVLATSSMSGLFHGGSAGVYTTTKFAVVGMMEALRAELAPKGIGVSVLCPGLVATNIVQSARNRPLGGAASVSEELVAKFRAIMAAAMDPYECGEKALLGVMRNDMYILTHPEFEQGIRDRADAIVASIRRDDEAVPAERLQAEHMTLRNAVYSAEKARLARLQNGAT